MVVSGQRRRPKLSPRTSDDALARVSARLEMWKRQRNDLAQEIEALMKASQRLLAELGGFSDRRGGRRKGYKASAATKAKLRAAWRRRKAAAAAHTAGD